MVGTATYDFAGESALVTGSTSGIGRGIARALAAADANVVVNGLDGETVEATAADLNGEGDGSVVGVAADVSDDDALERLVEGAIERFDGLDVLVNNAAVWPAEESMAGASLGEWDRTMGVNVRAQFHAAKLVAADMVSRGTEGRIVNVTSQAGDRRAGDRGLYGVSKTAIKGLTWRMASELAEDGIRMNAVSTDLTESGQVRAEARIEAESSGRTAEEVLEAWGAERPLGRLGQPEDLADAVLFLASDRADYVAGTILRVAGGGNLS